MRDYDPTDHYWIVGGDESQVYSSAAKGYVAPDADAYTAWVEDGGAATRIASFDELKDVLAAAWPAGLPVDLVAHAGAARLLAEERGIIINGATIKTDRASQAMITGAFALVQQQPSTVIKFKTAGGFVSLSASAMIAVAVAVGNHVQACFAKEADVLAAIQGGSITTAEAIDAAFAGL